MSDRPVQPISFTLQICLQSVCSFPCSVPSFCPNIYICICIFVCLFVFPSDSCDSQSCLVSSLPPLLTTFSTFLMVWQQWPLWKVEPSKLLLLQDEIQPPSTASPSLVASDLCLGLQRHLCSSLLPTMMQSHWNLQPAQIPSAPQGLNKAAPHSFPLPYHNATP